MEHMDKFSFDQRTQEILENLTIPFAIYQYIDKRVVTIAISQGFCDQFGFKKLEDAYEVMDNDMYRATHPDDKTRVADAAYRFAASDVPYDIVYRTRTLKDPDYIVLHAYGRSIYPKPGVRLCLTWYAYEGQYSEEQGTYESVLNQTLNRFLTEESQYRGTYYDYMTGLPNMAYFYELAEAGRVRMREQNIDSAIVFFDLIGLKQFNHWHGFDEGNRLIRAVAAILAKHFSNENCARFAQDHFAAFAPEEGLKERLEAVIAECADINGGKTLPIRIGIYPDRIEDVEIGVACDRARLAANIWKKNKESYYAFFDMELMEEEKIRQHIIDNLDRAIEEGWIQVYYQPIVRSTNGKVCDVEALARWNDPVHGMLMPASFIPVLEESMLIHKLDLCVVKQVLKDQKANEKAGVRTVPVSINFSRADFDAYDLVHEICRLTDEAQVDRKLINIEITESIVGSDFDFIKEQVRRFREQGFRVWMDDFGSGYSSLDVLQSIRFDLIKFDMGFLRRLDEGDEGKIILTEMMKMATSLGVDTICEGVETKEQAHFLQEIGCSKLQGYYFMKPVPPKQFIEKYVKEIKDGIENPQESAYYDTMGRVNLYDLSFLANMDESVVRNAFDTVPMGVLETNSEGDRVRYVRTNQSFRDFMKRAFAFDLSDPDQEYPIPEKGLGSGLRKIVRQAQENINRTFIDEEMDDGSVIHSFVRRIGTNPVNGKECFATAVLSITEPDESATFADIASSLAADYYNIYLIDLDTNEFIEYTSQVGDEEMSLERHGGDFFESARRDTMTRIYEEDREPFLALFTKENVLRDIDRQGVFTTTYRLIDFETPKYVNMKITRMQGGNRLILGVSIIDAHMKQVEEGKKLRQEKISLGRVAALSPDYLVLYTIDPETGHYTQYNPSNEYEKFGLARQGEDFYHDVRVDSPKAIAPEDLERHLRVLTKENMLREIKENGFLTHRYRMLWDGESIPVSLKAAIVEENDGEKIILGITNDEEQVRQRRERERIQEERLVYARLHALTGNFICVYVVDPETDDYREFSATNVYEESFAQAKEGTDFFGTVRKVASLYNHADDVPRFLKYFTKENIMAEIERSGIFMLTYRLMMEGEPLHVQMSAAMVEEKEGPRLIVGLNDIDAQYRQREIEKEIERQKEIYDQITESLAEQYDTLYYIDIETNTYSEISATAEYKKLNVPATGNDFYAESRRSIRKYVHPEDQERVLNIHYKDVMLQNLEERNSFSSDWRLVVNGQVKHIRHTEIMARDRKHIIVCIENIDAEVRAKLALEADQRKNVTYTQIAERLASYYDLIYYINCETSRYAELSTKKKSGELKVQEEGDDFFAAARRNADRLILPEDRERIKNFLDRDHLISQLENRRQLTEDYRMSVDGGKAQYTRMTVTYSSDHSHFIICVENRDKDVRKEQEHLAELSMANEMARRDDLTHVKNKTAYNEMEQELQKQMVEGIDPFGILICDVNGLKLINDTEGHKAGDDYIKNSCRMICRIFHHSPVFRIGGDEFVVVLRNQDYDNRTSLLSMLRKQVEENVRIGEGPVVASGLAEYQSVEDHSVEDVFNRADSRMYEDKTRLKEQKLLLESRSFNDRNNIKAITEERRSMLDSLFKSFDVVAEGTYVYLCDMKYDFSRWSKSGVDAYGLPSEYMYGAGDIWENHIHPEDRAAYHKSIDEIFAGNGAGHDMQYRVKNAAGEYDVCTCRGIVIRDPAGEPDYFVGTIRNHGIQGHIDTLTGLRNQYGFFEDLEGYIRRKTEVSVSLFGISKFAEINEMYGYHFGNRVLQCYARSVYEKAGNTGRTYRIDGTKFAVISTTLTVDEMRDHYKRFRAFLHEEFRVDGQSILLDLHCGALQVSDFDIDTQTVYACLNYADEESKTHGQGELIEFRNDLSEDNNQRLEKLHAIRTSIMHNNEGFYLLYQPVVDAQTEQLIGAEALLRWKDDRYGMVPPDQFIPILESDPLFPELGEWIIRQSIFTAKQILEENPGFIINVNLSYTQLEKPDFVDMVLRILDDLEYPPEHLCFEVTERCRLLDLSLLKQVLTDLKSRGILVALDDFGTGFSSVGILKEIPINIIKIDRTFVREIEENDIDRKLVRNIADLASIFSAKVCVEGIETEGMRDILKSYHVESFQGYYYAKPMLFEQFLTWESGEANISEDHQK